MSLKQQVEALRTKLPEPKTLSESNGFCIKDINGAQITMTLLGSAAKQLVISNGIDAQVLMAYLEDKDPKIRFIAAQALEYKYKATPGGMSVDDIVSLESKGHKKMVQRFRQKIDEAEHSKHQ
jgi:hypothetical protein